MRWNHCRSACFLAALIASSLFAGHVTAAIVAQEDFDGGAVNLISGFDPSTDNLDGGPGDWFGVGNLGAWPQGTPPGVPFSLTDDSVADVAGNGTGTPFPTDTEGVFGQNRSKTDAFFGISDTRDFETAGQPSASWTFDISGFSGLELSVDMGAQANDQFDGFPTSALINFSFQIDGGPTEVAFVIIPTGTPDGFSYRAMDSGAVPAVGANGPLLVSGGTNPVTKILADTGLVGPNTALDKTPASGPGAGLMDTFTTAINGTGSQLVLTMTADLDFEAMAFDNIVITGVPEPGTLLLFAMGAVSLPVHPWKRRRASYVRLRLTSSR